MIPSIHSLIRDLIRLSHDFYQRGWSLATSSNYSARVSEERLLITASGRDKSELSEEDILLTDLDGKPIVQGNRRPSAEALLHCDLYKRFPSVDCVLHVHTIYSSVLSISPAIQSPIELSGYEMLKALSGVTTHEHTERIPVMPNHQNMDVLSKTIHDSMKLNPDVKAFLIAGHGLYTWGRSIPEARRHVEAFEFLLECEYRRRLL
jgi:methylthioribulose-1-phosphate dehydratase